MGWQRCTSARGLLCAGVIVLGLGLAGAAPPSEAALTAGVGADYFSGPDGQIVRDVLGYAGTSTARTDLTFAVARYDNSHLGPGTSVSAVGTLLLEPTVLLQLSGTRSVGSHDHRAWRLSMGPILGMGQGRWLALTLSRSEDNFGTGATGLSSELGVPISPRLAGSVRASFASVKEGGSSFLGAAGATWTPARRVQLFGEMSVGRDVIALPGGVPAGAGGVGPTSPQGGPEIVSGPSFLTGVRFVIR
ncbi:MAG TPA: hypothetical protein VFP58_14060 [Candidatus Eisenbacteria bacterium]|nr:hypothetical protein [Candidatus Eisenbacteria bacterium]